MDVGAKQMTVISTVRHSLEKAGCVDYKVWLYVIKAYNYQFYTRQQVFARRLPVFADRLMLPGPGNYQGELGRMDTACCRDHPLPAE